VKSFVDDLNCSQAVIFFVVLVGALVVYFVTGKEREREKLWEPDMPDCHKGTVKPTLNGTSIYITNHSL
jgi:hypothetical protein